MTGDLITKKLPKYKLEAMERIAYLCFKEINPLYNNRFDYQDFKSAIYKFEGSSLYITLGNLKITVKLYGDFPRVTISSGNQPLIRYDVAKKILSKYQELEKNSPLHNSYENVLFTEFNLAYRYLRTVGRLGTRLQYKGE